MDSTLRQASGSAYVVIGPEGAINFAVINGTNGRAVWLDADIRRLDEVEEAQKGEAAGRSYCKKMRDHLEDFYAHLQDIKAGRKDRAEVAAHMLGGADGSLGKARKVERNIHQFLTGKRY
jgi:predicted RNA-binding protein YlxR (DUF448 family)